MSSIANVGNELRQQVHGMFIPTVYYLDAVSMALTVYEHLLTLNMERRVIWGSRRSLPTVLFLTNRYILWFFGLSSALWDLVQWNSSKVHVSMGSNTLFSDRLIILDGARCYMAGTLNVLFTIFLVLVISVFLAVRVHAINGHRWFWTCLVFLLASASAPYNFAALILSRFQQFNGSGLPLARGCFIQSSDVFSRKSWNRGTFYAFGLGNGAVAVQACGCLANAIVVFITWYRTKDIIFSGWKSGMRTSLASSMLRSGIVFFLADLFLNAVQIHLFVRLGASITTFSVTVESILTSRFILSLRTHDSNLDEPFELHTLPGIVQDSNPHVSTLVFDQMAGPLDFWGEDEDGCRRGDCTTTADD